MTRRKRTVSADFAVEPTPKIENLEGRPEVTPEPVVEDRPEVASEVEPEVAPAPYTEAMAADDNELLAGVTVDVSDQLEAPREKEPVRPVRQASKTVKKRQRNHLKFVR